MYVSEHKPIIVLYMFAGCASSSLMDLVRGNQGGLPVAANLGILAVVVLLLAWNVKMYLKAKIPADPEFPTSKIERYTRPVAASASFVVGFLLFVIPSLSK